METINIPIMCKAEKCPVCGKKLVMIDNLNYYTLICKKCHTTVFEEFDGTVHKIKYGIMKDGYNASLDIFMKSLASDTLMTHSMDEHEKDQYCREKLFNGRILGVGIYQSDIFNYFIKEMDVNNQQIKNPCIYFNGYEKYLDMIMVFKDEISEIYTNYIGGNSQ